MDETSGVHDYRPGFHFTSNNWLNDPNGPMYYRGYYHLFYQHKCAPLRPSRRSSAPAGAAGHFSPSLIATVAR